MKKRNILIVGFVLGYLWSLLKTVRQAFANGFKREIKNGLSNSINSYVEKVIQKIESDVKHNPDLPFKIVLTTKDAAEATLEVMKDILSKQGFVYQSDVNKLLGRQESRGDTVSGWNDLRSALIREAYPRGWVIKLPLPEGRGVRPVTSNLPV